VAESDRRGGLILQPYIVITSVSGLVVDGGWFGLWLGVGAAIVTRAAFLTV
jgi:hypothetical protein